MKKLTCLLVLFFILISAETFSLPRFALQTGALCVDCHVNPTGGNLRNTRGWNYGKNKISMISPREDFKMTNKIGDNIQFGFDYRGQYLGTLTDSTSKTDFQRMSASVYTNVDLSENIKAFARYDFIQSIWEGYAVLHILPNNSYIKGGTFSPNYGLKIDDHTAYTRGGDLGLLFATGLRQGLIYDPRYIETGVELGGYFGDFAFLTMSVGNPRYALFQSDPTYTANLMITPPISSDDFNVFLGGSFAKFSGVIPPSFQNFTNVNMYGGYIGLGFKNFTLLGEYDIAENYLFPDSSSNAMMLEASYLLFKGLETVIRYDRFDPLPDTENDDKSRFIFGFEFFPYSFIELRPQFRLQMEKSPTGEDVTHKSFVVQIHLWY
jgi:hypothetical protein